jgi:hypothetical protein
VVEILSLPGEDAQVQRVQEIARVEPWSVTQALLLQARACARSDSSKATTLARFAVLAAQEADPVLHPLRLRAGLLATAYSRLGEAFRLARRHDKAEKAFLRTASYLATISPDDLEARALYLSLLADLRADQGHHAEANHLRCQADILLEALPYEASALPAPPYRDFL